jgi:hypothetical protein
MGWNSWDCYGASVTEEEVLGNAEYMAEHLLLFGWEYIVVELQWYEPGANSSAYRPFVPLEMDAYSRLIPAPYRFPSTANGQGFKPLADRIHALGLKFGIHILRGIPRQAVHQNTPIFTRDEQVTMMTLWCIARSPLMVGAELRDNGEWTRSLLTNLGSGRKLDVQYRKRMPSFVPGTS